MTLDEIRNECDQRDDLRLECDGLTQVFHYVLDKKEVRHEVHLGRVTVGEREFEPHYWIELEVDGVPYIIDYRARMWLGPDAPHGVFQRKDYPEATYEGYSVPMPVSERLYTILIAAGAWAREIP